MDIPHDIEEVARRFQDVRDERAFTDFAGRAVAFQRDRNPVYARFHPYTYLPVRAFKDAAVATFPPADAEAVFGSSGTGDVVRRSRHFVYRLDVYRRAVLTQFRHVFGSGPFTFLFLLPVTERSGGDASSLLEMARILAADVGSEESGYLLDEDFDARSAVRRSNRSGQRTIVFGTAFGLLDFVDRGKAAALELPADTLVIETGGMKTHRREIRRADLHALLAEGFGLERNQMRSEYGMCELMSQFYAGPDGLFRAPPWVRFRVFDPDAVETVRKDGEPGALAVFDLANVFSVSAVLTEDRAVRRGEGFELLGRLDGAELRGCNLLLEEVL